MQTRWYLKIIINNLRIQKNYMANMVALHLVLLRTYPLRDQTALGCFVVIVLQLCLM